MATTKGGSAVLVTLESGETRQIDVLRRQLPRGSATDLFYVCPWCRKPRRYLYLLTRSGDKLVDYLGLRCQVCAGLRFGIQGYTTGAPSREVYWGRSFKAAVHPSH